MPCPTQPRPAPTSLHRAKAELSLKGEETKGSLPRLSSSVCSVRQGSLSTLMLEFESSIRVTLKMPF